MDSLKEIEERAQKFAHSAMEYFELWDHPASDSIWNAIRCSYLTAYQDKEFGTPSQSPTPVGGDSTNSA